MAQKKFSRVLFGENHPYANTNVIEDYDKISRPDFVDFHSKQYTSGNCKIIVAGLYNDSLKKWLETYFGEDTWGNPGTLALPEFMVEPSKQRVHFVEKADALQSAIRMGCLFPNRTHPDFYGLNILITLLGGFFGSRLMTNIREDKGYTYGIGAGIFTQPKAAYLTLMTEVGADVCKPALDEIYKEIEKLQNELVPAPELDIVRNYLLGETLRSFDGIFAMSGSLKTLVESDLDYSHYDNFVKAIRTIRAEDLMQLAQKYLQKDDIYEVVAGK